MSTLTKVKLGLTLIGLILFAYGARMDDATIRSIGIGFVAVAWAMRFVRRVHPPQSPTE
ncbi:MAG: hypothetical protein IPK33_30275 [Gemmatimonadetes bacterium]|nr:hypothetical protein [Gemmatimonadota bacterium]